jgi:methionyl-tRNA formyltransferase
MDEGMDTGDIIKISEIPILDTDNVGILHDKLSILGRDLLKEVLPTVFAGTNDRIKQGEDFTLAPKVKREDEKIDFNENGINIINKIRGLSPWPLANFLIDEKEIKVLKAHFESCNVKEIGIVSKIDKNCFGITCRDGIIYLDEIKVAGKSSMPIKSFINGIDINKYLGRKVD